MKLKKRVLKKCLIQQILIITIFVTVAFSVFRAGEEFQVNTYTEGPQKRLLLKSSKGMREDILL